MPRVLVVEDDPDGLDLMCDVLRGAGYEAVGATNGAIALERLQEGPPPSVLLLDLMMPVMNGWQLMDEIKRLPALASLPVVLLSADSGLADTARALGAAGWLRKPASLDAILAAVAAHAK
jgi:CheY-like chemotaxis protein